MSSSAQNQRKKILATNDDGIEGEGLKVLVSMLSKFADVYILAPDSNRSAVSSKISMGKRLSYQKIGEKGLRNRRASLMRI